MYCYIQALVKSVLLTSSFVILTLDYISISGIFDQFFWQNIPKTKGFSKLMQSYRNADPETAIKSFSSVICAAKNIFKSFINHLCSQNQQQNFSLQF